MKVKVDYASKSVLYIFSSSPNKKVANTFCFQICQIKRSLIHFAVKFIKLKVRQYIIRVYYQTHVANNNDSRNEDKCVLTTVSTTCPGCFTTHSLWSIPSQSCRPTFRCLQVRTYHHHHHCMRLFGLNIYLNSCVQ